MACLCSVSLAEEASALVACAQAHSYQDLQRLAQATARADFVPRPPVTPVLAALSYSDYIKIAYRYENATWWGQSTPFWIESFHQGFVQTDRVMLFTTEEDVNRWIPFSTDDFDYDSLEIDRTSIRDAGHAGIKIAGRFPSGVSQEILTFLGSSYFRARSEHTVYGASARGLAVNIGLNQDEEFPFYRAFWIHKPEDQGRVAEDPGVDGQPQRVGGPTSSP